MHSTLEIKRSFWPSGFVQSYCLSSPMPPCSLPVLVDLCVKSLIPKEALDQSAIMDLKGRDATRLINEELPSSLRPSGEELAFIAGEIPNDSGNFQIRLQSSFKQFAGAHHILHDTKLVYRGDLPAAFRPSIIARVFPLRITHFRLGFEFFKSSFMSLLFGFAPIVNETLLLEADTKTLNILILAEGAKKRDILPLSRNDLFNKLGQVLAQSLKLDICQDYRSKLGVN